MGKLQVILITAISVIFGTMLTMLVEVQGRNVALNIMVQAYKERFAQRLGEDGIRGPYSLLTLDNGLTWWDFDTKNLPDGSEAVLIVGRADAGLVRRLNEREKDD